MIELALIAAVIYFVYSERKATSRYRELYETYKSEHEIVAGALLNLHTEVVVKTEELQEAAYQLHQPHLIRFVDKIAYNFREAIFEADKALDGRIQYTYQFKKENEDERTTSKTSR